MTRVIVPLLFFLFAYMIMGQTEAISKKKRPGEVVLLTCTDGSDEENPYVTFSISVSQEEIRECLIGIPCAQCLVIYLSDGFLLVDEDSLAPQKLIQYTFVR
jgi:hypothetical protein